MRSPALRTFEAIARVPAIIYPSRPLNGRSRAAFGESNRRSRVAFEGESSLVPIDCP